MRILGSPGSPSRVDNTIYSRISVDYQVKNKMYITGGTARVESIKKGRINMFVAQRPGFIDRMKATPLNQYLQQWFENSFFNSLFSSYQQLVNAYAEGHNGVILPAMMGPLVNLADKNGRIVEAFYYDTGIPEIGIINEMTMKVRDTSQGTTAHGGHFCVFIEPLFKYFEAYFGVNLNSDLSAIYSLFNDDVFKMLFIPVRHINVNDNTPRLEWVDLGGSENMRPLSDIIPYNNLSAFDLFSETLKILGYGVEEVGDGFEIVRLDYMGAIPVTDDILPGYMEAGFRENLEYKPIIEGYGQQNIIKMSPAENAGEMAGARILLSNNENSEATKELFKVNAYVPAMLRGYYILFNAVFVPIMAEAKALEYITFLRLKTSGVTSYTFWVNGVHEPTPSSATSENPTEASVNAINGEFGDPSWRTFISVKIPEVYTVSAEYNFLEGIINSPETYKVKRWVTSSQMENFRKIATYYVPELGGWFYVNKIKGFNPVKSKQPVEFELIKVPWQRMPQLPEKPIEISDRWIFETGYWDDGGIWKDSENWAFN